MLLTLAYAQSSEGGVLGGGLLLLLTIFVVYFVPGLVAWYRKHQNENAIVALNLLLGWTLLGWVAALVWSLTSTAPANPKTSLEQSPLKKKTNRAIEHYDAGKKSAEPPQAQETSVAQRLGVLESLKNQGLISDAEYAEKRNVILEEL